MKYAIPILLGITFVALVLSIGLSWESIAGVAIVMAVAIYAFTRKR